MERKYRHILDIAKALKLQSCAPKSFWSECILIATYLINRPPINKFCWQSPYERLYRSSPQHSHLRKFGYFCFPTHVGKHKDKFKDRAIKVVLLAMLAVLKPINYLICFMVLSLLAGMYCFVNTSFSLWKVLV